MRRGSISSEMDMAHVCFYVCCSNGVGVCWNVSCVSAVVKDGWSWSVEVCFMCV